MVAWVLHLMMVHQESNMYHLYIKTMGTSSTVEAECKERPEVTEFGPHMICVRYFANGSEITRYLPTTSEIRIRKQV